MKTYNKTVAQNRLVITHDTEADNPRKWWTVGEFITCERLYKSPDNNAVLEELVKVSGEGASNVKEHEANLRAELKEIGYDVRMMLPVSKYDHGGVIYSLGAKSCWDVGVCGFYIVLSCADNAKLSDDEVIQYIKGELEQYNQWVNGEVYQFALYDDKGRLIDSCGEIYNLEDIRGYLNEEWKTERLADYIID